MKNYKKTIIGALIIGTFAFAGTALGASKSSKLSESITKLTTTKGDIEVYRVVDKTYYCYISVGQNNQSISCVK